METLEFGEVWAWWHLPIMHDRRIFLAHHACPEICFRPIIEVGLWGREEGRSPSISRTPLPTTFFSIMFSALESEKSDGGGADFKSSEAETGGCNGARVKRRGSALRRMTLHANLRSEDTVAGG